MFYRAVFAFLLSTFGVLGMTSDSSADNEKIPSISAKLLPENQLLQKARAANGDLYSTLKSFVCREEIERYKGDLHGSKTRSIDHVSANLSFENGVEHYFDIHQNAHGLTSLSAIAGAWS